MIGESSVPFPAAHQAAGEQASAWGTSWLHQVRAATSGEESQPLPTAGRVVGRRITRTVALALVFASILMAVYAAAFVVRFDGLIPALYMRLMLDTLPLVVGIKLAILLSMGVHRGRWLSASFADLARLAEATSVAMVVVLILSMAQVAGFDRPLPRSVLLIDWLGSLLALWGVRGCGRALRERYRPLLSRGTVRRALIVSASDAGESLIREIRRRPDLGLHVVGILDSDPMTHGRTLDGVRVFGHPDDAQRIAEQHRAEAVVVPTPAVSFRAVRSLVEGLGGTDIRVQVVPGVDALLSGAIKAEPRDVDIDDLLCRAPVQLDGTSIDHLIRGKTVLVTGAVGSIGSELCRQALVFGPARLVLLDHSENGLFHLERELKPAAGAVEIIPCLASVTDAARLRVCLDRFRPEVVLHAAAHKHVPLMEANPGEAIKNNTLGTRTLVDEVIRSGAEAFVMISTDKAVRPTSVMGATKRLAELYVQAMGRRSACRMITVRFGNVLGSNGSVVPIFREQIRSGGPITVTHPAMTRFFMTIPEAARLVLQAGSIGEGGEIFVLDMGEPVKVVDLARGMIRLAGLHEGRDIEIAFTGLRPGEKLYEELYDDGEECRPTSHPKLNVTRPRPRKFEVICHQLDGLAKLIDRPATEVVAAIAAVLPEYQQGPRAQGTESHGWTGKRTACHRPRSRVFSSWMTIRFEPRPFWRPARTRPGSRRPPNA